MTLRQYFASSRDSRSIRFRFDRCLGGGYVTLSTTMLIFAMPAALHLARSSFGGIDSSSHGSLEHRSRNGVKNMAYTGNDVVLHSLEIRLTFCI